VDIYGSETWKELGGDVGDSNMELVVEWPEGMNSRLQSGAGMLNQSVSFLFLLLGIVMVFL
jgi:hypothetical protein